MVGKALSAVRKMKENFWKKLVKACSLYAIFNKIAEHARSFLCFCINMVERIKIIVRHVFLFHVRDKIF